MPESARPQSRQASAPGAWRPQGAAAWSVTIVVALLAACMVGLAWCMLSPVRWDGVGFLGAVALFFPLHLFLFTAKAAGLTLLARRCKARAAAWLSVLVLILTAIMALAPAVAAWQRAHQLHVPLSLGDYLANAVHLNLGEPQPERSVVYGTAGDGTPLELDVWRTGQPGSGPLRPAVVFLHGGAWIRGQRSASPDWDRWLNELGYEVFDVEYRLPPPVRWQAEIGDVKSALGWVAAHAAEYHVDAARISAMGNSAGGNLAMLAAYSMGDPQLPPSTPVPTVAICSVINLYGPTDLALLYRDCESPDYVHAALEEYIGGTPAEFPDRYRALSPLSHVGAQAPPTLTVLGSRDRLVAGEQADLLEQALAQAGVPHELCLLPGNDHGFDTNWGGFGTQIARARIEDFLARTLGEKDALRR
jgi:acetyl esterase/lipase